MNHAVLRASVTDEAGGVNLCPNGGPLLDVSLWSVSGGGGPDVPTLEWTSDLPADSPVGAAGAGHVVWQGPDTGSVTPPQLDIPNDGSLSIGTVYTVSIWVLVPSGSNSVRLSGDGVEGDDTGTTKDAWVRLTCTFTATVDAPSLVLDLWPDNQADLVSGMEFYFAGCLIQPGALVGVYTNGGGQDGDPVQILVDGADTPITANGLSGYIPTPGDRLLVQRVGSQMEVLQFLSRGTVPYLQGIDLSDLAASVDSNSDQISAVGDQVSTVSQSLTDYQSATDSTISGLQGAYDVLSAVGTAGVQEDYIWVGDDPALSTIKTVQISTFVQAALYAGDGPTFASAMGLLSSADLGDITFSGTQDPPMTTFYNVFTANGRSALPWNA